MRYVPRDGAHITVSEAAVIGAATETIRGQLGRNNFSVEEFEIFCRNRTNAVHPIWRKKRDEFSEAAGRTAAAYLLRSIVVVEGNGSGSERGKEVVIVLKNKDDDNNDFGTAHTPRSVRRSADLLNKAEEQLKETVRAAAKAFSDVSTIQRMKQAVEDVMDEF